MGKDRFISIQSYQRSNFEPYFKVEKRVNQFASDHFFGKFWKSGNPSSTFFVNVSEPGAQELAIQVFWIEQFDV